ncbi:MAG: hypothetical protein JNM17_22085 [Archangium sp.]|nr:hypothetical protein [Archangium sp.]
MATRKDEWTAEQLDSLLDTSAPKLEARMFQLWSEPKSARIAEAAVNFFVEFPLRFREQLGTAAAATGVAWLHGAKASAFAKMKPPKAPNDVVPLWHQRVTAALHAALGPRAKPKLSGGADTSALPSKAAELQAEWLKRAARVRSDELDVLLAAFPNGPTTQIAERGVALLRYPVDARIADAAAAFVLRPPVNPGPETAAFTIAGLLLCVHGNRSHRKAAEHLTKGVDALVWVERALPDVAAPVAAKKSASSAPKSEQEFLRFIADAPKDDARVATFTDWLLEKNDPRGTFLSLQRAGKDVPKTLLKKHEKAWLGSLAPGAVKDTALFRGGFVREITLRCWRGSQVPTENEPLLALLESLDVHGGTNLPIPEWLANVNWKSLRALTTAPWIWARVPDALLAQLDTLGIEGNFVRPPEELLAVLKRPLPKVKTLVLRADWREGATEVAKLKSLERVVVETHEPTRWEPLRAQLTLEVLPAHGKMKPNGG